LKTLSIKKRRDGLIFAQLLRCAASAAPEDELRREVLRVAGSVERRFGFTLDEKKEAVLATILDGAQTDMDLIVETGFNPQDIRQIVKLLEAEGRVKIQRQSVHSTGRPSRLIVPISGKIVRST
jgi:transcription initiation factor IIE alpha subunit